MVQEALQTKSKDVQNYGKCALSQSALKQTKTYKFNQEDQIKKLPLISENTQMLQNGNSFDKRVQQKNLSAATNRIILTSPIKRPVSSYSNTHRNLQKSSQKTEDSNSNRLVSMCFQSQASPFLNMISSATVNRKELINNPVKLGNMFINDQQRQVVKQRVVINGPQGNGNSMQNSMFKNNSMNQNGTSQIYDNHPQLKQQSPFSQARAQSAKSNHSNQSHNHTGYSSQGFSTFYSSKLQQTQSQMHQIQQLKKTFSSSKFDSTLRNFASQDKKESNSAQKAQTCLVWNKETQNLVLQTVDDHKNIHSTPKISNIIKKPSLISNYIKPQDNLKQANSGTSTMSSLYLKERKKIQLQQMIDKKNVLTRPLVNERTERVIPNELRKVVEEIERDLQKYYSTYTENQKLKGRMKNGQGIGFLENGDIFSGQWKDGKRDGFGSCKFFKGGYYKGQWVNDQILGEGVLVIIDGLTIGGKFKENGMVVAGQKYQILYPNGEYFDGQINQQQKKNGKGAYFYSNGDFYEGDWVNNKRQGKGKLYMDDGSEYTGDFSNDKVFGEGVFKDADGNRYESSKENKGYFDNGRLQKKGKAFFVNGDIYKGYFKDGKFDGKAKMSYKHISTGHGVFSEQEAQYKGEFKHGRKHGFGKMEWQDGSKFKGIWEQDQRKSGVLKMKKQQKKYEGEFKNDLFHGKGRMTFIQQKFDFEGTFQNGECPLKGKITYHEIGDIYEGQVNQSFLKEGKGKYTYKNGETFEGNYLEDLKHGYGLLKQKNGDYYKGNFMRDKRHGQGQQYEAKTQQLYDGYWRDDERNGEGVLYLPDGSEKKGTWKGLEIISKTASEKHAPLKKGQKTIEQLYDWGRGSNKDKIISQSLINKI
eukprot:403334820